MTETIAGMRLKAFREIMKKEGVQWYFMGTADPHGSEYINDYYKERQFLSGFTGSNGDLLIGMEKALLWTDGRYFVQAEKELAGSGIELMRMGEEGVPSLTEYLRQHLEPYEVLGADGKLLSAQLGEELRELAKTNEAAFRVGKNLMRRLWRGRLADSAEEIRLLPMELCGESYGEKLHKLREKMREHGAVAHILTKLDDQMWLYNMRGDDIAYNPVAYAYSLITMTDVTLYVKDLALTGELCLFAEQEHIALKNYGEFYTDLSLLHFDAPVLLDKENVNYLTLRILQKAGNKITDEANPTEALKAVKNETELAHIRQIYLKDSVALTKFLRYIKENVGKTRLTELDASDKLEQLRQEIPEFNDLSFTTISAFGANAAMMHYEATPSDHSELGTDGVYLVDSGGQYDGGTTDVTRTLIFGTVEEKIRHQFTRVAAATLHLQNAVFLRGCTGRNLDILARAPIWQMEMDYKCGTGHGVGYMLNVHEGPQGIRTKHRGKRAEAELVPGMLVSDEPGVYVAGSHGIRTENILLVQSKGVTADGEFLCFEPLTFVPIDRDGIVAESLSEEEKRQLNEYHKLVREKLLPYLEEEDAAWLKQVTEEIK